MSAVGVQLAAVRTIHRQLVDVSHDVALVMLRRGDGWFAFAVCSADGDIRAWDGWYNGEPGPGERDALSLDWDDWDDMPSKLLMTANSPLLATDMGYFLMPTYSPARMAGELVADHVDDATEPASRRDLSSSAVVCYIPVVDVDVFERTVAEAEARRLESGSRYAR